MKKNFYLYICAIIIGLFSACNSNNNEVAKFPEDRFMAYMPVYNGKVLTYITDNNTAIASINLEVSNYIYSNTNGSWIQSYSIDNDFCETFDITITSTESSCTFSYTMTQLISNGMYAGIPRTIEHSINVELNIHSTYDGLLI